MDMNNQGITKTVKYVLKGIKDVFVEQKDRHNFDEKDIMAAELIRNTHSIEKGLCLEHPRLGFGKAKMESMMHYIDVLCAYDKAYYREVCCMALDAICEYINFHRSGNEEYSDEWISMLDSFVAEHQISHEGKYGGTKTLNLSDMDFNIDEVEKFFNTRHSIRDFTKEDVDEGVLLKALQLAQRAPSACNRQGVRIYVFEGKKLKDWAGAGIGGFADAVNKYVMITAKKSCYRTDELNQYIVSASIYAGYLSLTLHLYSLGACIIQRSVTHTSTWEEMRKSSGIDEDEQVIMLLGVGKLKEEFKVPVSHRLDSSTIIRFVK